VSIVPARSLTEATSELLGAYRAVRRAADRLPPLRRTGVVAQLADSSAAAHRAMQTRHDEPRATQALADLHQAFAEDDWLVRANRWRRRLVVLLGIQAAAVVALVLSILAAVRGLGESLIHVGADRGVVVIAFSLMVFLVQASDRYGSWDKKLDRTTMDALRRAERNFYAATGGRAPLVRRDHGLRLAVALLPAAAWLVACLFLGLLLISATQPG
jgi:hypothetical protein